MISSRTNEDVTGLMRHESTDILYCCWVMSIAHCPLPRWRSAEELFSKVEQRTEATSDLKNSPLFYAVLSEHRLLWRRLTTFGFIWQTLWWWSFPLCTTARVQTRWLTIILLELWLPRRERQKLRHWRIVHIMIGFVQEQKSGTIGSYFPNINEQCLSLH